MSSIDRRVVEMEFDNKQFENGIKDTLNSLDALKKGLNLDGATKALTDVESAGKRFSLRGMADALDNISSKFSIMGAIGFTVIQDLTRAAMRFAKRMAGAVLDPLISGGRRRAMNIEQAKFQFQGLGMDIEATMASALAAVTGTAFGLDEAAKAAGQFGASGMRAGDQMTSALRAISGVAAMTSSSYDDIANIFTKVAGNGRVMGDDLLRMSSRGLNAAATLADHLGISEQQVRQLVTEGQISFEMFYEAMDKAFGENATKANETYTGSLANMRAALSRIGANFFTPWLEQQRDLFNALSPAIDNFGEALKPAITALTNFTRTGHDNLIGMLNAFDFGRLHLLVRPLVRIIQNVFEIISRLVSPIRDAFRQIFPAKSLMDIRKILDAIEKFTNRIKMGEETADKLRRTFAGLFAVLGIGWEVIKAGAVFFADLFGMFSGGSGGLLTATANIGDFLVALHEAIKNGEGLTNFFKGLSNVLQGPIKFLQELGRALLSIFDFDAPSADNLTNAFEPLGRLGEILVDVWGHVISNFKKIWEVVKPLGKVLEEIFGDITQPIKEAFSGLDFKDIIDVIQTGLFGSLILVVNRFRKDLGSGLGGALNRLTQPFAKLTFTLNTMQNTLRAMTLMQIGIAVGLLTASVVGLSKVDAAGLTRALTAMSVMFTQLFASMAVFTRIGGVPGLIGIGAGLILFATAIRVLTSSVRALAQLSWEELSKGLVGVSGLLAGVTLAVRGLSGQTAGMIRAGTGLLILSFGIKVLTSAVTDLSGLSWEDMSKGLVGVGALLASLAIFTKMVAVNKAGVLQGAGLVLLATGIKILASAVTDFSALSWEGISKGLASIGAILTAFAIFSNVINPAGLVRAGVSLVLISAAMNILARAMGEFSRLSWEEIAKGLVSMAGALVAIVLALNLMPPSTIGSATALVLVSVALNLIAKAMQQMGGMGWGAIAKGLVTMGGALLIIAVAMAAMSGALPGAAATLVVAGALAILAPVLKILGGMSWGEIARGLVTLAGVFVVLGLAGLVLTPLVPTLLGLGLAIALVGAGVVMAGAGVLALSVAITALAIAGAAGTAAIVAMAAGLIGLLPMLAEQLGLALVVFAGVIATAGPQMFLAISAVLGAILDAIDENVPKAIDLFDKLLKQLVERMVENVPIFAKAALDIMVGVLRALNSRVPQIIRLVTQLIVKMLNEMAAGAPRISRAAANLVIAWINGVSDNLDRVIRSGRMLIIRFINGISDNMVKIVDAGMRAIIRFIDGVAKAIRDNNPALRRAGKNLASAIVSGMTLGLSDAVPRLAKSAAGLAQSAVDSAKKVLRMKSPSKVFESIGLDAGGGMAIGMTKSSSLVDKSVNRLGKDAIDMMKKSISGMSDLLAMDTDLNPVITPVLDLSEFHKDTAQIDSSLSGKMIDIELAYSKAKDASTRYIANEAARNATTTVEDISPPAVITYNQYNQSPKALSSAEIYRQTKNQLSVTKGALTADATQDA